MTEAVLSCINKYETSVTMFIFAVQSGTTANMLGRMNRGYPRLKITSNTLIPSAKYSGCGISTDIITRFLAARRKRTPGNSFSYGMGWNMNMPTCLNIPSAPERRRHDSKDDVPEEVKGRRLTEINQPAAKLSHQST